MKSLDKKGKGIRMADTKHKVKEISTSDTKLELEHKRQIEYDMIYLAGLGINGSVPDCKPDEKCLERYRTNEEDMKALCFLSARHFIDALVGTTIKQAGVTLPKYWEERIVKAIRKVLLFDMEREKLCAWMDREQIWYLPLKGIVLKDFYPSVGMRQMSDNDILFDADAWERVQNHMLSEGYEAEGVGQGNHDVYKKPPVYNFEMHRFLYGKGHTESWVEYYSNVKERLIPDQAGASFGYHMRDEDFYIYITSHAYKHYAGSGTGIRTLLDFYAYLHAKEETLDFSYIEQECTKLGIAAFEKQNRSLCKKVFTPQRRYDRAFFEQSLSQDELDMLKYYLSSGVYGTFDRLIANRMEKQRKADGKLSKLTYYWHRIFPGIELYGHYPILVRHRWLVPGFWLYRIVRLIFSRKRKKELLREVKAVKKAIGDR